MAWVAFDRGVRSVERVRPSRARSTGGARSATRSTPGLQPGVRPRASRRSRSPTAPTSSTRALLMMPLVGLPAGRRPARCVATVAAIERELLRRRLRAPLPADGRRRRGRAARRARACSCPARSGSPTSTRCRAGSTRRDALFERLLDLRNDVGPALRGVRPRTGRQLGNFPQAFSHLSLINTAMVLGEGRQVRGGRARP